MATIDSTPAAAEWKVYAGDRNAQPMQLFASAGVPWDLTGCTFKAQARSVATDAVIALEAECVITDAANGLLTVSWDGEEVRTLLGGQTSWSGVYDLEVLEPSAALPVTLLSGGFTAKLDVTKP